MIVADIKGTASRELDIDGFVQDSSISIANALELHISCTNPLKSRCWIHSAFKGIINCITMYDVSTLLMVKMSGNINVCIWAIKLLPF